MRAVADTPRAGLFASVLSSMMLLASHVAAAPLLAQGSGHAHGGMAGTPNSSPPTVSPAARKEIARVTQALQPLGSTDSATAAGFRAVLGWIPTMGVHWVNPVRMLAGSRFDAVAPSQLMFSKIDGRDSLVGAAYSYIGVASDTTRPPSFDGAPAWHEHPELAPPGTSLVMLHVWFVPSPDGPFAGTNPNLPYWALDLPAPDSARMHDTAFSLRVRKAALALGEIADPRGAIPMASRRASARQQLLPQRDSLRDSVRVLLPELRAAMLGADADRVDHVTERVAGLWDAMYALYLESMPTAAGKQRVVTYAQMLLGQHVEH